MPFWKFNFRSQGFLSSRNLNRQTRRRQKTGNSSLPDSSLENRTMLAATVYIMDNTDAGFTTIGKWNENERNNAYEGTQLRSSLNNPNKVNRARWNFTGIENGTYNIYGTWAKNQNANAAAQYVFKDGIGGNVLSRTTTNQQINPDDLDADGQKWELLGNVTVSNNTLVVVLKDGDPNNFVLADAVRIELQDGGGGGGGEEEDPVIDISSIPTQNYTQNQPVAPVDFTVSVTNGNVSDIQFSITSSNTFLIPNESLSLSGSDGNYTLNYTPTADASGTAEITIVAQIGTVVFSRSFLVIIDPVNEPPVASAQVEVNLANYLGIESATVDLDTLINDNEDPTLTFTIDSVEIIQVFGDFTEVVTLELIGSILNINAITNVSGVVLVKVKGQDSGGLSAIQEILIQSIQIQS